MSGRPSMQQAGPVAPAFALTAIRSAIARGAMRIDPVIGLEKYCPRCSEWWPADSEFWHLSKRDGLNFECRSCAHERRYPTPRLEGMALPETQFLIHHTVHQAA